MKTEKIITRKTITGFIVRIGCDLLVNEDPYFVDVDGDISYFSTRRKARRHFNNVIKQLRREMN